MNCLFCVESTDYIHPEYHAACPFEAFGPSGPATSIFQDNYFNTVDVLTPAVTRTSSAILLNTHEQVCVQFCAQKWLKIQIYLFP